MQSAYIGCALDIRIVFDIHDLPCLRSFVDAAASSEAL
jgi:hypothetical protein